MNFIPEVSYDIQTEADGITYLTAKWQASNGHMVNTKIKYKGEKFPTEEEFAEVEDMLTEIAVKCEEDIKRGCFDDWLHGDINT